MQHELIHSETQIVQRILAGACEKVSPQNTSISSKEPSISWNDSATSGKQYYYIKNPSGTVRWFFPKENMYPVHLALYNSSGIKARAYKLATHLAYQCKLKDPFMSGNFTLENDAELYKLLKVIPFDSHAIFTGTPGENRKSIIALNQGKKTTHFGKLAHSDKGVQLLKNEAITLAKLSNMSLQLWKFPQVVPSEIDHLLLLSNVAPVLNRDSGKFSNLHLRALMELYQTFGSRAILGELNYYEEIKQNLEQLTSLHPQDSSLDPEQIQRMIQSLQQLFDKIDPETYIHVSLAHRDFTPWNMYLTSKQLHVYDWELAEGNTPFFYDLFHFIFQGGILIHKHPFSLIHLEIQRAMRLPTMQELTARFHLNLPLYYQLYLLHLVSYYLKIYIQEPHLHMQAHWLIDTWEEALAQVQPPIQ